MTYSEKLSDTRNNLRNLRKSMPETFAGFMELEKAASAEATLDKKQKEMIALGCAVALRCEECILSHVGAALRLGITRDEVVEVLGTAIQMSGGPGLMYAAKALAVYDEMAGS